MLNFWNERNKNYNLVQIALDKGLDAHEKRDFAAAKIHFDAAAQLAERYSQNAWGHLTQIEKLQRARQPLLRKAKIARVARKPRRNKALAREKSNLAERHERTRIEADTLFDAADSLRFRLLLGEGKELVQVFEDLQKALAPFYVLKNEDWTKLNPHLALARSDIAATALDRGQRALVPLDRRD